MPKSNTLKMLKSVLTNPKRFASEWKSTKEQLANAKELLAEAEHRVVDLQNEKEKYQELARSRGNLHVLPMESRMAGRAALLSRLHKSMRILEVGPGYGPIAPKRDEWNSVSIDHATREQLIAKYSGMPTHLIEDVDFVWTGGPMEAAVPRELWGTFDACIASHLIEHIPNPLGFYNSMDKLIAKGGELLLIVPDKRFTFDFFKPHSTTSEFVQALFDKRTRHTKQTGFDDIATNCNLRGAIWWSAGSNIEDLDFVHKNGLSDGMATYEKLDPSEHSPYVDFHGWFYTPASFALMALETHALGLMPFKIDRSYPTEGCEFYVSLSRGPVTSGNLTDERLRLSKQIIFELAEQAEALRPTSA